jgi:hypothetical protein
MAIWKPSDGKTKTLHKIALVVEIATPPTIVTSMDVGIPRVSRSLIANAPVIACNIVAIQNAITTVSALDMVPNRVVTHTNEIYQPPWVT